MEVQLTAFAVLLNTVWNHSAAFAVGMVVKCIIQTLKTKDYILFNKVGTVLKAFEY